MSDDGLNLTSFLPDQLTCSDVLELAQRVYYRYCTEGEIPFPTYFPGFIQATLKNGDVVVKRLDINYCNPENPMKRSDVERKFRDNVSSILAPQAAEKVIELDADIENCPVTELTA